MELRRDYLGAEPVETVYFGGGTPSLLGQQELASLLDALRSHFTLVPGAEITLEANPDDIHAGQLAGWRQTGINRLSIGVQSFFEEDLRAMNRAHTARQAESSLDAALEQGFSNITVDLIYGQPGLTDARWKSNVDRLLARQVPHLSCYALTVEPRTPLAKQIRLGQSPQVDPDQQAAQFLLLMDWMEAAGFEHYEISNFALPGYRSRHNTSYWQGKKYLGLGPSAHSYDGQSRQWNVANNQRYLEGIRQNQPVFEREVLTPAQQLNEYVMTSLRTGEGLDLDRTEPGQSHRLLALSRKYLERGLMQQAGSHLRLTREGKLLADGIAADLFL